MPSGSKATPPSGSTPGAEPRLAAARALAAVLDGGQSLTAALEPALGGLAGGQDRALARRLAVGVLRDLPGLEFRLERLLQKPLARRARLVHFLLLSAISELTEGREPARAVVHASVQATRLAAQPHLSRMANGILRTFQRQAAAIEDAIPDDPVHTYGFPAWLVDAIRADWPEHWQAILQASNRAPPIWLRVNQRRSTRAAFRNRLEAAGHPCRLPEALPDALILERPSAISGLPGYDQGHFSVQDGAAQWAVELLDVADGQRVLDACAAPGGKSAHVLERARVDLTAIELDPERLARMQEGLDRLGLEGRLIGADATRPAAWWDGEPFDRILVDAPCSATGVIRRHPDIRWLRRPGDIQASCATQDRLLEALWPLLEPGGILVYATCSILAAENRARGAAFLERTPDARVVEQVHWPGIRTDPGMQILPGEGDMDGLFYLVLGRLHPGA